MARADYEHLSRDQLLDVIERLEARIATLEARIKQLEDLLDQAMRGGKRQAAPFSKGPLKCEPQPPGRKPGDAYGRHAHREAPSSPPDQIIDVPLPNVCPDCGGTIRAEAVVHQHQIEIPRRPIHRRFDLPVGRCRDCGRRVQPRQPLQTSDAIGAAACQLGPNAQTTVALMKNRYGLSYGDIVGLFQDVFGIPLSPGGAARAVQRVATRAEPVFAHLATRIRRSQAVCPDETGWKVNGWLHWLWTFVTDHATLYVIRPSRGRDVLDEVLGRDYAGAMTHDGWAVYDGLTQARHQQCLAHLLRRAKLLIEQAPPWRRRFPAQVRRLLQDALALRRRVDVADITVHGLAVARGRLERRLDRLLRRRPRHDAQRRFADHLIRHRLELLWFLYELDLEATNWRAEQAIRPAVVNRKVFGGNRTPAGAHALEVLASFFATCRQQAHDAFDTLSTLLHRPPAADLRSIPLPVPA